jgi:hypothetical protein
MAGYCIHKNIAYLLVIRICDGWQFDNCPPSMRNLRSSQLKLADRRVDILGDLRYLRASGPGKARIEIVFNEAQTLFFRAYLLCRLALHRGIYVC